MKRKLAMLALALGLCAFATGAQQEFVQVRAPQVPDAEVPDVEVPAPALEPVAFGSFSGLKLPHDPSAAARSPAVAGLEDALAARQRLAFRHFEAARQAGQEGRFAAAIASARQGVYYAPRRLAQRLQLLGLLLASGQWPQADHSASEAMRALGARPAVLVLRAHALQRGGQRPAASIYLDAALADTALTAGERLQFGLIAADAALAAGEPQKALQLLAPLAPAPDAAPDAGVLQRRQLALQALRRPVSIRQGQGAEAPAWATPRVVCGSKASEPFCQLWPAQTAPDPG